jgi:prevent-host-death family protein
MERVVKVHEAKTNLSALLAAVEAGEEVVIARGDTPVARLVPFARTGRRELGFVSYPVPDSFFEPLPDAELDAWEGNAR